MAWWYVVLTVLLGCWAAWWSRSGCYRRPDDTVYRQLNAWLVPLAAGVCAVAAGPFFADRPVVVVVTYTVALVWACVLTIIDLEVRRLPDALVLPGYVVAPVLLGLCSGVTQDWAALLRALASAGAATLAFLLLALFSPMADGLGLGDVKLAGVLGVLLGWLGWTNVLMGLLSGFVLGGAAALVLLLSRRADRTSHMSFGPAMLLGAYLWCLVPPG